MIPNWLIVALIITAIGFVAVIMLATPLCMNGEYPIASKAGWACARLK